MHKQCTKCSIYPLAERLQFRCCLTMFDNKRAGMASDINFRVISIYTVFLTNILIVHIEYMYSEFQLGSETLFSFTCFHSL